MRQSLYGRNAVHEALAAARRPFFSLQIAGTVKSSARIERILELAAARKIPISRPHRLKSIPERLNHQGVVLEAGPYPYVDLTDILERAEKRGEPPYVLLLDSLQDPQNFGALLRTAEAVGIHGVLLPLARSVEVTPAVVNASAGASEHLLIARSNLAQAMDALKQEDVWLVGLDLTGVPFGAEAEKNLRGSLALVIGSEGGGLHELTRKKCDVLLRLPMQGRVESLNAAVAGSVALYLALFARQQAAAARGD